MLTGNKEEEGEETQVMKDKRDRSPYIMVLRNGFCHKCPQQDQGKDIAFSDKPKSRAVENRGHSHKNTFQSSSWVLCPPPMSHFCTHNLGPHRSLLERHFLLVTGAMQ
jgi:hypothetical protein